MFRYLQISSLDPLFNRKALTINLDNLPNIPDASPHNFWPSLEGSKPTLFAISWIQYLSTYPTPPPNFTSIRLKRKFNPPFYIIPLVFSSNMYISAKPFQLRNNSRYLNLKIQFIKAKLWKGRTNKISHLLELNNQNINV